MSESSLLQRLKDRKLVKWTVTYLAVGWLLLEAFDLVAEQFQLPFWIRQGSTVLLLFGLLITVVLAWNHGERGRQSVGSGELVLLTLLVALAGTSVMLLRGRSLQQDVTAAPSFTFSRDTPPERSIAVLACSDQSPGGDQEYFASGLAEELTTQLAGIRDLRVAARTSAFSFRDSDVGVATIAAALKVRNVLECSVRREGDRVRIAAQLVDAVEGFERWSHSYDRAMGSMLAMAGEIAIAIADALEAELRGGERSRLSNRGTESREAYDLYLRGLNLHWMTPYSVENQFRGLEYFRAAIDADSTFAPAWALLADTYNGLGNFMVVAPGEAYPLAEEAALRAIALDDELAAGHTALGWTKLSYTFDWAGAEEEFRRTIDLAPSEFTGYHGLNFTLAVRGDFEEALAAAEEALSLDPLALWPRVGLAELRYKMGDFEAMLSESEAYLELQADDPFFLVLLAAAQAHTGAFAEAVVSAAKAEAVAQGDPTILLMAANAYAVAGDTATARERLGRMRILAEGGAMPVSAGLMALTYATLGELDEAFDWLGRGVETFESVGFIIYFPEFLPLRGDPRFGELLDRLGLPRAAYR